MYTWSDFSWSSSRFFHGLELRLDSCFGTVQWLHQVYSQDDWLIVILHIQSRAILTTRKHNIFKRNLNKRHSANKQDSKLWYGCPPLALELPMELASCPWQPGKRDTGTPCAQVSQASQYVYEPAPLWSSWSWPQCFWAPWLSHSFTGGLTRTQNTSCMVTLNH